MTRTRQHHKDIDIVGSLAEKLKNKEFTRLPMTASAAPNFTGIDGHPATSIAGNESLFITI